MALNVVNGAAGPGHPERGQLVRLRHQQRLPRQRRRQRHRGVAAPENFTVTLGTTQDDVTHVDYLPMRADLQSVTGDGSNLTFSMTGDGTVDVHVKTPAEYRLEYRLDRAYGHRDGRRRADRYADRRRPHSGCSPTARWRSPPTSPQGVPVLHNVTITDGATASTASGAIIFAAPTVAITTPGGLTASPSLLIGGTISEQVESELTNTTVTLYDNGSTTALGTASLVASATGGYTWSTTVTLSAGANSIVAKDTDLANMTGASSAVVYTLGLPPTITGAHATPTTLDAGVHPFTGVTITDPNAGGTDTVTITLSNGTTTTPTAANGALSGTGLTATATSGVYTLSGTAAVVTSELDLLTFKPAKGAAGSVTTTTFALSDQSTGYPTAVTNSATTVTDTDAVVAVTITGTHATSTTADAAVSPFTGVTLTDANAGATDTLTIYLSTTGTTEGTLSGTGLGVGTGSVYTLKGTAATITSELDALMFTPAKGAAGSVTTTTFELDDQSSVYNPTVTNTATTVTDTDAVGAPTITGAHATSTTADAAVNPFTGVTIGDLNPGATETLTITLASTGTLGALSGTGLTGSAAAGYTLTGTAATVTSRLDLLRFTPAVGAAGSVTTTTFTLSDKSSANATATTNTATTVTDTDAATGALAITSVSYGTRWVLAGTAAVGSTVTVYDGTTSLGTVVATTGAWSFTTAENNSAIRDFTVTASGAATASAAYFEGTGANDTFNFASEAALSAAALINGAAGAANMVMMTSAGTLTDGDFAHLQAIQVLGLTGASSVTLGSNAAAAGLATVNAGAGATSITDTNPALTVNAASLGAGNALTLAGSTAYTVTGTTGNVLDTGTGALNVTEAGAATQNVAIGSGAATITNAAAAVIVDATAGGPVTLLGAGTKTVNNLTGSVSITGAATVAVNASAGASVTTGNGNTTIVGSGSGVVTVNDTNAKGSGHTLTLSGTAAETITSLAQNVAASGLSGALNATTTTNALSIALGTGSNTINAGGMTSGVTLTLTGAAAATVSALGGNLTASLDSGALTATTTGGAATVTTGSGATSITDQSTGALTINATALTATNTLTLSGAGAATVTGLKGGLNAANDSGAINATFAAAGPRTIQTGSGADTITDRTGGGDTIQANGGGDTITVTGHTAGDTFSYAATSDSLNTTTGHDTITGFTATGSAHDLLNFAALNSSLTYQSVALAAGGTVNADSIAVLYSGGNAMVYVNDTSTAMAATAANTSLMEITLNKVTSGTLTASNFIA